MTLTLSPGKMYRDTEGIVYQILAIGRRNGKDVAFAMARIGDQDGVHTYAMDGKSLHQDPGSPDDPCTLVDEVTAWDVQVYLTRATDGAVAAHLGAPTPDALTSGTVRLAVTKDQLNVSTGTNPSAAGRAKASRRRTK